MTSGAAGILGMRRYRMEPQLGMTGTTPGDCAQYRRWPTIAGKPNVSGDATGFTWVAWVVGEPGGATSSRRESVAFSSGEP